MGEDRRVKHLGGLRVLLPTLLPLVVAAVITVPGTSASGAVRAPSAASTTTVKAQPDIDLGDDYVLPPAPPGGPEQAAPDVAPRLAAKGWKPLDSRYHLRLRKTYKLRLVGTATKLRRAFEAAVLDVPNTDITVMPGKVSRTKPRKGEILVRIADRSPCTPQSPNWWGCGGPDAYKWVKGSRHRSVWVTKGRIWIRPAALTSGTPDQKKTVYRHELGHVLGLGHYDGVYKGRYQIMTTFLTDGQRPTYQSGDRRGLKSGRHIETGHHNFRTGAVETLKARGKKWLFGTDATGHIWAWAPKSGRHHWYRLPGKFRGAPAAIAVKRKIHLYAVGNDGQLRRRIRSNGDWKKWRIVAATSWKGGVDAVRDTAGTVHVFGRNVASRSLEQAWGASGAWSVQTLGGTLIGDVAVLYLPELPAYSVWGIGVDGGLYQKNYVDGAWGGWAAVPGAPGNFQGSVSVTRDRAGRYRLVGVSTKGDVLQARWNGTWHFSKRKANLRGRVDLMRSGKKQIQIYAPDRDGILRTSKQTKRGWSKLKAVKPR